MIFFASTKKKNPLLVFLLLIIYISYFGYAQETCISISSSQCSEWNGISIFAAYPEINKQLDEGIANYVAMSKETCPDVPYLRTLFCSEQILDYSYQASTFTSSCASTPLSACRSVCLAVYKEAKSCWESKGSPQESQDFLFNFFDFAETPSINAEQYCQAYPVRDCVGGEADIVGPVIAAVVAATVVTAGVATATGSSTASSAGGSSSGASATHAFAGGLLWLLLDQTQFVAISGQFNLNYPQIYRDFADSFEWTNFLLRFTKTIEKGGAVAEETFANNLLTILLVIITVLFFFICLFQFMSFKYADLPEEKDKWQQVIKDNMVMVLVRILLLGYYQLAISASSEILLERFYLFLAIGVLIMYHIASPLLFFSLLKTKFKQGYLDSNSLPNIKSGKDVKMAKASFETRFKALYSDYHPHLYWFCVIMFIKKIGSGLSIGFGGGEFYAQISIALAFYIFYEVMIIWKRPYVSKDSWLLNVINNTKDIVCLILLIVLKETDLLAVAWAIVAIMLTAIVLTVILIAKIIFGTVQQIRKNRKEAKEKKSEDEPPLTLAAMLKQLWKGKDPAVKEPAKARISRILKKEEIPTEDAELSLAVEEPKQNAPQTEDKPEAVTTVEVIANAEENHKHEDEQEQNNQPDLKENTDQ